MVSNLIWIHCGIHPLRDTTKRNELRKSSNCRSRDMLNFSFSEKGLGLVSPSHFVYGFLRKMFLMLYSLNWPKFIAWLSLFLKIFGNTCITIVCLPGWDVINFEIDFIFLTSRFSTRLKVKTKLKILRTKRVFKVK